LVPALVLGVVAVEAALSDQLNQPETRIQLETGFDRRQMMSEMDQALQSRASILTLVVIRRSTPW